MPKLTATCHCGAVKVEVPRKPAALTDCNCSICRRYGVLWSYYNSDDVKIIAKPGATQAYAWGPNVLNFVRCKKCGCVMCWQRKTPVPGSKMGVNARNFEPEAVKGVRTRFLDGAKWPV